MLIWQAISENRGDVMKTIENTGDLAAVNQKILAQGEVLPSVVLKDGSRVQTGTVATLLHNIGLYNAGARGQIEQELALAIPTLFKVGLFELFPPSDWLAGGNPERKRVGELAMAYLNAQQTSHQEALGRR